MMHPTDQQAQAHDAIAADHYRGEHRVARERFLARAAGQHHGNDQRHFDYRDRYGQHQCAEGLADPVRHDFGVMNRGAAELRAFAEGIFSRFPDLTFELQSSFSDGTRGGAEWVMRGTRDVRGMPATAKRVEVRGASIFEFVGDKIRRCSDYWDMATYLKQLGLTPSA